MKSVIHLFTAVLALTVVQQAAGVVDLQVAVRADGIAALGDAADLGDLGSHLAARQHAALARLRALRELDLEGLRDAAQLHQALGIQVALRIAHAVLGGADLHDHVATDEIDAANALLLEDVKRCPRRCHAGDIAAVRELLFVGKPHARRPALAIADGAPLDRHARRPERS